jgi:hypothetical protein
MPQAFHPSRFPLDHIVARQHGGKTVTENLALACLHCNSHKGPNLAGLDPVSGQLSRLFDPRQQIWRDHFEWRGAQVVGLTTEGRVTVAVLYINDPDYVALRASLMAEGFFTAS